MRKKVFQWLGREFVSLSAEGEHGRSAADEAREIFQRFDDRPGNQMGVGRLRLAGERQMIVDDPAIFFERFDGNGSNGGRRRD